MLWRGQRESDNVEDERGSGGGGGRIVLGGGIGTVILVVLYLLLGGNPQALFNSRQAQLPQTAQYDNQAPRDEASKFVAVATARQATAQLMHRKRLTTGGSSASPAAALRRNRIAVRCAS